MHTTHPSDVFFHSKQADENFEKFTVLEKSPLILLQILMIDGVRILKSDFESKNVYYLSEIPFTSILFVVEFAIKC